MYLAPTPLAAAAADLRSGALPLDQYVSEKCAWLESADGQVQALLPESNRRRLREAGALILGFFAVGIGLLIGVGTGLVAGFYGERPSPS